MANPRVRLLCIAGLSLLCLAALPLMGSPVEGAPVDGPPLVEEPLPGAAADVEAAVSLAELFAPPPLERAHCNATNQCDGGTPVSCSGHSVCQLTSNGVSCDGVPSTCPDYCTATRTCYCWCETVQLACTSNSGDCQTYPQAVVCNGQAQTCDCPQRCGPFP